jgi:predicted metalloendopeptidase
MKKALVLICVLGCATKQQPPPAPVATQTPPPKAAEEKPGIDLAGIDKSVAPGDNFFAFANGTWVNTTEIPPDRASYGTGQMLAELTATRTRGIIEDVSKNPQSDEARKVGDYYATFMDETAIEAKGAAPLKPDLDRIAAIKDKNELAKALGETLRADVDVLNATSLHTTNVLGLWVAQDLDDPKVYAPFLLQGGLGMPDRDYYLDDSPRMADLRQKYVVHVAAMLKLAGVADPQAKAQRVFDLEKRIAQAHATRVETEDVEKGNNHWKRSEFATRAPGMNWDKYFGAAGLDAQVFVVWQPKAVTGISALVKEVSLETWKDWMAYQLIEQGAPYLSSAFVDERFAFFGRTLSGTPKLRERWKRAIAATDDALGEVVGKLYVERYFPPSEKARAEEMVKNELAAFAKRIDALTWMAPQTKEQAKAKLKALKVGVGYPNKWRDYSGLEVARGDAFGNARRAQLFDYKHNLHKLGTPVDREEWVMNAHLVNAVNLPAMNALNFPAAILQPPFFDPTRAAVMDYGAAGSVIGHEISHSFDNEGALFDAQGRLHNWWTPEDFAHFKASGEALAKQYDAYAPFPDLHVRGEQTLGENIADVAGLNAAYDAYRISLGGKEAAPRAGFTGDQLFFLSFAQSWREKAREPARRQQIITDGHAPAEFRADTVRNLDQWYPAFNVQPGQRLFLAPDARVRVW